MEKPREPRRRSDNVLVDLVGFLRQNKKWWMIPILLVFLLLSGVVLLAATEAAPFIYTLF